MQYLLSSTVPIPDLCIRGSRFEPGPNFTRSTATPVLDCSGVHANTHEIWLLQLPLDVRLALCCMHAVPSGAWRAAATDACWCVRSGALTRR